MKKLKLVLIAVLRLLLAAGLRTNKRYPETYLSAYAENEALTKRNEDHKQTATQLITDRLDHLIEYTKLFVHGNQFNSIGFELVETQLWETLKDIRQSVRREAPRMKALTNQVTYATNLVRYMKESAILLHFYPLSNNQPQKIINRLIRLNLKLTTLFDLHGAPDPGLKHYDSAIENLYGKLNEWEEIIQSRPNIPLSLRLAFDVQLVQAEKTLQVLRRYVW